MLLALDVGNSQIYGGVFSSLSDDAKIKLRFRRNSKSGASSDETGIFLRQVLRENGIEPKKITHIAICSVVPDVMHSLRNCCLKYFGITPFILQAGVKTGLRIKYRNPVEVGADRISNAIAATQLFPNEDLVIVDLGTATTFCAVTGERDYLGGLIIPGLRISMEALESKTARLPSVEIIKPKEIVGKGTVESIQSGLYYSHMGAIREIVTHIQNEVFKGKKPKVIGTGGFAGLFSKESIFDVELPDLVLVGLFRALLQNLDTDARSSSEGAFKSPHKPQNAALEA